MGADSMRIGEVARRAGVSTRALRYYEEQGLLRPERTPSGQRTYPASAVERVRLIQQFFTAGLPSRVIQELLPCVDSGRGSAEALQILATERDRITAAMADLAAAREALDRVIDSATHPTPEHCPALREPAWAPYASAPAGAGLADAAPADPALADVPLVGSPA
ncbi:MAG TPA: MerR family transcriptional regulator [Luteimicrobium sp.]|nr:MerR family transcriptional regulator [Luteimicrobium sp.]